MPEEKNQTTTNERAGGNGVTKWLVLDGNRLIVTGVLTGAVVLSFVAAVTTLGPPFVEQIAAEDTIETIFATMLTVIVTGSTLVVTIGQLVLTQENGPLGDQQERMDGSMAVRESVAEQAGSPSPTDPAAFLGMILESAIERANTLRVSVNESDSESRDETDGALREEIDSVTASVIENADAVRERLDGAKFGTFAVVSAALGFDYSSKIYRIEQIPDDFGDELGADLRQQLTDLNEALTLFGPAREHVKTLYFQWALIELSQMILYAAVPALAVAGIMIGIVDAGTFPGTTFGIEHIVLVVGTAFGVTLVPFMLFVVYVLRILTVAKQTLAIEPLELRE